MRKRVTLLTCMLMLIVGGNAIAAEYEVNVTNLTRAQIFTPLLVVSHEASIELFEPGAPASSALATIAESGNIMPMEALLGTLPQVRDTNTNGVLLEPGQTTSIVVKAGGRFNRISLAGMLIPTNDTFVGARSILLPNASGQRRVFAIAYDAGSEPNDQNCANMPGPRCMGQGLSPEPEDGDEGHVYVSNGFHDRGTRDRAGNEILGPASYDWRNPVALIIVERMPSNNDNDDEGRDDEGDDEDED